MNAFTFARAAAALDTEVRDFVWLPSEEPSAPAADMAGSPSAEPERNNPLQAFIASDEDSWLLPASNAASPDAHECPS